MDRELRARIGRTTNARRLLRIKDVESRTTRDSGPDGKVRGPLPENTRLDLRSQIEYLWAAPPRSHFVETADAIRATTHAIRVTTAATPRSCQRPSKQTGGCLESGSDASGRDGRVAPRNDCRKSRRSSSPDTLIAVVPPVSDGKPFWQPSMRRIPWRSRRLGRWSRLMTGMACRMLS